jgi:hypothetical protein
MINGNPNRGYGYNTVSAHSAIDAARPATPAPPSIFDDRDVSRFNNVGVPITNGQVLVWNSSKSLFEGATQVPGGSDTYVGLDDVNIPGGVPVEGLMTHWNATSERFEQAAETKVDPTTRNIIFDTVGQFSVLSAQDASISSTAGQAVLAGETNAFMTAATGSATVSSTLGDVTLTALQGQIELGVGAAASSVAKFSNVSKSAAQYATDIAAVPEGVPNVEFVTSQVSDKLSKQGDADGVALSPGTTDDFNFNLVRNSKVILEAKNEDVTLVSQDGNTSLESTLDVICNLNSGLNNVMVMSGVTEPVYTARSLLRDKSFPILHTVKEGAMTLTNKGLQDSTTTLINSVDATKLVQFDLSNNPSAFTSTYTFPSSSGELALASAIPAGAIVQNGNAFGVPVTIGTNDNQQINFEVNATPRWVMSTSNSNLVAQTAVSTINSVFPGGSMNVIAPNGSNNSTGGLLLLRSGSAGGPSTGNGGSINILTGTGASSAGGGGTSGVINVITNSGAGSGALTLATGTAASFNSGEISLSTGNATLTNSGGISLTTGQAGTTNSASGSILLQTGNTAVTGNFGQSGSIELRCGIALNGIKTGGNVILQASPGFADTDGKLSFFVAPSGEGMQVEADGTVSIVGTTASAYEALIIDDNDLPNKKYVDSQVVDCYMNARFLDYASPEDISLAIAGDHYPITITDNTRMNVISQGGQFTQANGVLTYTGTAAKNLRVTVLLNGTLTTGLQDTSLIVQINGTNYAMSETRKTSDAIGDETLLTSEIVLPITNGDTVRAAIAIIGGTDTFSCTKLAIFAQCLKA